MARKIFRTGNSTVVSLPADVLETLGLALGDEVTVLADPDNERIVIKPVRLPDVRPGFLERVDRFIDDYGPALTATGLFLELNGYRLSANNPSVLAFTRQVAVGKVELNEIASWFRENCHRQ